MGLTGIEPATFPMSTILSRWCFTNFTTGPFYIFTFILYLIFNPKEYLNHHVLFDYCLNNHVNILYIYCQDINKIGMGEETHTFKELFFEHGGVS